MAFEPLLANPLNAAQVYYDLTCYRIVGQHDPALELLWAALPEHMSTWSEDQRNAFTIECHRIDMEASEAEAWRVIQADRRTAQAIREREIANIWAEFEADEDE